MAVAETVFMLAVAYYSASGERSMVYDFQDFPTSKACYEKGNDRIAKSPKIVVYAKPICFEMPTFESIEKKHVPEPAPKSAMPDEADPSHT